ncbi:MAG: type II toxin-antitoxin system RelE/ParE family toxin [Methanoregula sp.]|jgi:mRNA-degrading endonuclease RelE of RelBE toxin-antitoxin system|nr:type II toxin-antitoxin system RelE/ParE family toxin [Methanoregula sp.]
MYNYLIRIKDPAEQWLRKYDKNVQQKFANKIMKLKENPELHGKPLRKPLHGIWELYFEKKFRIYYSIDKVNSIVYIEGIYHKDEC